MAGDKTDAAWPIFNAARGQIKSLHANNRFFVLSTEQFKREMTADYFGPRTSSEPRIGSGTLSPQLTPRQTGSKMCKIIYAGDSFNLSQELFRIVGFWDEATVIGESQRATAVLGPK